MWWFPVVEWLKLFLGIFKTLQSTLTIDLAWVNLNFSCISEGNASWSTGGGGPNFPTVPWQADSSKLLQRLSKKSRKWAMVKECEVWFVWFE